MKKKYNATQAILDALYDGRRLSQLDCHEFMVEDMRTVISHNKHRFERTHDLKTEWFVSPIREARLKRYWIERKEAQA